MTKSTFDCQPQYKNRNKGPHGQVRGLRESILLAIKLNRTLVIPTFFIDGWDDPVQLSSAIDPEMTSDRQGQSDGDGDDDGWRLSDVNGDFIELESLFEFISIASTEEFLRKCKNIDSIFQSRLGLIYGLS